MPWPGAGGDRWLGLTTAWVGTLLAEEAAMAWTARDDSQSPAERIVDRCPGRPPLLVADRTPSVDSPQEATDGEHLSPGQQSQGRNLRASGQHGHRLGPPLRSCASPIERTGIRCPERREAVCR